MNWSEVEIADVPPHVVTVTFCAALLAPLMTGTIATICWLPLARVVSLTIVPGVPADPAVPPKSTAMASARFAPVIVNCVPGAAVVGLTEATVGAAGPAIPAKLKMLLLPGSQT